jgi:hypothetical protein
LLSDNKHLLILGLLNFVIIYASTFVPGYGYFIDEFYYIACANRPAFGYVDQPPLAAFILMIFQFVFGSSIYAIRILPALAASGTVIMTGLITKQLGGSKLSQSLSAFCILASPVYAAMAGFFSMNAYEPLLAVIAFYLIILMIKENNPKRWFSIGIVFGLGLMNKHTAGVYIFLLVVSMLITPQRKLLFNRWFLYCVLISAVIFLPNILWNASNGFPTVEFYRNITLYKNVPAPPLQFLFIQILYYSPFILPFWLAGMLYLLFGKNLKQFISLGLLFLLSFIFFMVTKTSRPDRLAFAYPIVVAAGAIFFQGVLYKYNVRWVYGIVIVLLFAWFSLTVPVIIPYLNYEQSEALTNFLGIKTEMEKGNKPRIPQTLADRIGWKEKVNLVVKAYESLNDPDKKRTLIAAGNYGDAGAIEFYGKNFDLPRVVCGHNNYYLWSRGHMDKDIVIDLSHADNYMGEKEIFGNVVPFDGEFSHPFVTSHENHLKVFICREPSLPPDTLLEHARFYY